MNLKLKKAFRKVKKDVNTAKYDAYSNYRYLYTIAQEQQLRLKEMERRLGQLERIRLREVMEE